MELLCHTGPVTLRRWLKSFLFAILLFTSLMCLRQLFRGSINSSNSPEMDDAVLNQLNDNYLNTSMHSKNKTILFWTPFYGTRKYWKLFFHDTITGGCPVSNCRLTQDRQLLPQAHAVVFHLIDTDLGRLPDQRVPGQIWVLFTLESPAYPLVRHHNLSRLNGLFNWTMTYRWDSDVPVPYGLILPRDPLSATVRLHALPEAVRRVLPKRPTLERRKRPWRKDRLLAWMVSNCDTPSRREDYVTELRKHVHVSENWCRRHRRLVQPHGFSQINLAFTG